MESILPPRLFFDPRNAPTPGRQPASAPRARDAKENRLFCASCKHLITRQEERIAVAGGHEHACTNPHGFQYRIGCFRAAPGCTAAGTAEAKFTWFRGYTWRLALCAGCRAHLGWLFEAGGASFYGLIVNRLTAAGPARP
jgi:hypothetical protein